jgi:predicted PurR-regulated permease PerM
MSTNTISNGILKAIASIVAIGFIIFFIYKIQIVILYVLIAIIVTLIVNPFVEFLKRKLKFSNTIAVVFTIVLMLFVLFGLILMFVPLIMAQGQSLSVLNINEIELKILDLRNQITVFLSSHDIDAINLLKKSNLTSKLNFNFIPNFINSILEIISNLGMGLASVLFITFFILKDKVHFLAGIKSMLPDVHEEKILNSISKINSMLSKYFSGLLLQLFIVFILYFLVLIIFGIQNAFVIAFLCAILNIVPYVGPLIGSILAAVFTMISNLGTDFQTEILPKTIYVLIGFSIVQVIDNNVSQPLIFSKRVNSHPLEIFIVTLISGFLFGILGMIIAIPFYTILKVIAKEFYPENKIIKTLAKNI